MDMTHLKGWRRRPAGDEAADGAEDALVDLSETFGRVEAGSAFLALGEIGFNVFASFHALTTVNTRVNSKPGMFNLKFFF